MLHKKCSFNPVTHFLTYQFRDNLNRQLIFLSIDTNQLVAMQQYKIIVVDDDEDDRLVMADAFRQVGFNDFLILSSGDETMQFINSIHNPEKFPRIVITDLNMPKMNGLDLVKAIRLKPGTEQMHIAVYSTSSSNSDKENCLNFGANEFILKPMQFDGYCQIARKMLHLLLFSTVPA